MSVLMLFLYTKGQVLASIQTANSWGEREPRATHWLIACVFARRNCKSATALLGCVIIDLQQIGVGETGPATCRFPFLVKIVLLTSRVETVLQISAICTLDS